MKKTILFIASSFLLFTTSCTNNKPSKPKTPEEILNKFSKAPGLNAGEDNYVISIPKGWTPKDTVIRDVKFHFILPPAEEVTNGANITILNEAMSNLTFDQYVKASIKNMQSVMPGFKLLGQGTFSSTTGMSITWIHYFTQRGNIDLEGILYFLPHNNIAYLMTGIALKGKIDQYRNIYDRVAQSFKFKN